MITWLVIDLSLFNLWSARGELYTSKQFQFTIFSKLLVANNPNVTADEKKRIIVELLDSTSDTFENPSLALAANTILQSDYINTQDAEKIVEKLEKTPFFNELTIRHASRAQR